MWKYIRRYLPFAIFAALFMIGEVMMDLIQPGLMSQIVDNGVLGLENNGIGDLDLVWRLGIQMILLVLFGGLCGSMNNAFVHLTGQNIGNEIRKDCFCNIMTFSFPQLDQFGTGSLVTRVTNDITQVQNFISQFVRGMIRTTLLTFGSMYFMFSLNKTFGLIVLCAFPFIVGCMVFCLWKANPLFMRLQAQLDFVNGIMQEDISGIRIIKACVQEIYEKLRFGKANDALIKTQLRVLVIFAFMNPVINALMYLTVAVILLVGSYDVGSGVTTPGAVMAAITYTTQLLNGVLMLVMLFQNISRGYASWKRVREVLYSKPELEDGEFDEDTDSHGMIEFRDVSFSYPGSGRTVLEHINLKVNPGETIAVMGATGCGKTSLINLISRFYDAAAGNVLVDGVDVREYRQKALLATKFLSKRVRRFSRRRQMLLGQLNGTVEEMVSGYRTVVAYNHQEVTTEEFCKTSDSLTKAGIRTDVFSGVMGPVMNCIGNIGFVIIAVFGGYFSVNGIISVGVISAFIVYAKQFSRPINEIAQVYGQLQTAVAGAERVFAVLDEQSEDKSGEELKKTENAEVIFKNVQFSYEPDCLVLKDFTLTVPSGKKVALVGATGSGKTTVVNLLMRFYDAGSGEIFINQQNLNDISRDTLRKNVAIVLQDTVLFVDSVLNNLKYGNAEAEFNDIAKAVEMSRCKEMIEMLPQGYDTVLSESGSNISQGQRQLLAIARAFVADPEILILDEATSNVDTRTEKAIQDAMHLLMQNRTSIIIAHRLSTIRDADLIVVMEHGRIVERGDHETLLSQKGKYYELYMTQYAGIAI